MPVLVRNLAIDSGNTGSLGSEEVAVVLLIACGMFAGIDKPLKNPDKQNQEAQNCFLKTDLTSIHFLFKTLGFLDLEGTKPNNTSSHFLSETFISHKISLLITVITLLR